MYVASQNIKEPDTTKVTIKKLSDADLIESDLTAQSKGETFKLNYGELFKGANKQDGKQFYVTYGTPVDGVGVLFPEGLSETATTTQ